MRSTRCSATCPQLARPAGSSCCDDAARAPQPRRRRWHARRWLAALALACVLARVDARGCAKLPPAGPGRLQQCARFDSFTTAVDDAFSCAPLAGDVADAADWTAGLRPQADRECADWDGTALPGCADAPSPVAWRAVALALLAAPPPARRDAGERARDVARWYEGAVADAPLLIAEAVPLAEGGDDEAELPPARTPLADALAAALPASATWLPVRAPPGNGSTAVAAAVALRRAALVAVADAHPDALFVVLLEEDTRPFPTHLQALLRTADAALGAAQAYQLGSAAATVAWSEAAAFGRPAHGAGVAYSRAAVRLLATAWAQAPGNGTTQSAAAQQQPLHPLPSDCAALQRADLVLGCAARRAGVITVHCGHFVVDGAQYGRRPGDPPATASGTVVGDDVAAANGTEPLPLPLPGNPVLVRSPGPLAARDALLCAAPATTGDPFCAREHRALQRLGGAGALGGTAASAAGDASGGGAGADAVHIVLAHYNENEAHVAEVATWLLAALPGAKLFVYSKGSSRYPNATILPNVGRESHTYISHIVRHYHALPRHLLFSQAYPNTLEVFKKRVALFTNASGMLNLGGADQTSCDGSEAYKMVRLRELYVMTHHQFCPRGLLFISFMNGQFLVSRPRVLANSLHFYKYLLEMLDAPPTHFVHQDVEDVWPDLQPRIKQLASGNNANYFSFVMERAWTVLFRCMQTALNCGEPFLPGMCQCLDED